ncbi:homoserine dehydrogenase [Thomasclavelia cocleata]|uniref:Homoserine dehydrogenase n=1 Tax=Thomasclavelia cocleata TaxID=69824 RepID=A0A1I0HZ31_9FIRM|nr:homoserine dehydrogenase [Thomasclavelia cocleata]MCR1961954.1 homoserine dehydrogenase [Thomasclavelia cocleata]NDO42610.1 homoserine dehydrogenase [Thomasclavelia cocleata]PJN79621.1 homoserine dehydrogenase [Thomasclavelia cocleata]SET89480.1 homoserine dehydrogenase [Thomasclavelia cocleata]
MKIGIIGLGTVGYGVVEILTNEKERLSKAINEEVVIKYGCGLEEIDLPDGIIYTKDFNVVINDDEIDVVVELIGGTTIAKTIILDAINKGKHVVTANKALLAHNGKEIFMAAKENNVHIFYEASVGGGIPVLVSQKESLVANNTKEIIGILNGTTNFILTLMENENLDFDEALTIADGLGYVEANPALDLDGIDAAHKICILAQNGFKKFIDFDKISATGIRDVTKIDMDYAKKLGYRFKMIAQAKEINDGIGIDVAATLVSKKELVANVMDAYNVVEIDNDYVENVIYYGKGAGRYVTASAVVSDIIKTSQIERWSHDYEDCTNIYPITKSKYYLRASKPLDVDYEMYFTEKRDHIYITHEIELADLTTVLNDEEYTIFKVRG